MDSSIEADSQEVSPERIEQITTLATQLSSWLVQNVTTKPDTPTNLEISEAEPSSSVEQDVSETSDLNSIQSVSSNEQLDSLKLQLDDAFDDIDAKFPELDHLVDPVSEEFVAYRKTNAKLLLDSSQPNQISLILPILNVFKRIYSTNIGRLHRSTHRRDPSRAETTSRRRTTFSKPLNHLRRKTLKLQEAERARKALEAERLAELDAQHKDRLRTILDARYSAFQESLPTEPIEIEPVGFQNETEVEERASIVQYLQSMLSTSQISSHIQTANEAHRRELQTRERLQTEQARKQERALLLQQQAEQKQQQRIQRKITLQQKAERAREQALLDAQQRKDERAQQRQERQQQRALEKQQREEERAQAAELAQAKREQRAQEQADAQRQLQQTRKSERLAGLRSQLIEEARRQEYQEIEAQIEADVSAEQRAAEVRRQKQSAFLEQLRREEERRANDPLLLEQQRQQEVLARKQERLQRLQTREREIKKHYSIFKQNMNRTI